ncbi:uncharacterized protein LOC131859496 isoform X2 [Cryptomeria japonica]|uniref:uncharacterized protein LOC131859496 isoform X2 n=1 Tax=Cryptomeria japonica TaxID=3369 RepID=UPI0027DA3686|nr:uncharacterized protein LOC131859496 isoform X2 [Cryptomeria japonica]
MSNVWMMMRRFTNNYLSALRNVKNIQNSHAHIFLKGYNDKASQNSEPNENLQPDSNLVDKAPNDLKEGSNPASSEEKSQLDSTDSTESVRGPKKPPIHKGGGPIHNKKHEEE